MKDNRFFKYESYGTFTITDNLNEMPIILFHSKESADKFYEFISSNDSKINQLTNSRDKWRNLSKEFMEYCNCWEEATEKLYDKYSNDSIRVSLLDELLDLYDELEKKKE